MTGFWRGDRRLCAMLVTGLLACDSPLAQADGLQGKVHELIAQRLPPRTAQLQVDIGQPAARISACEQPRPYLVHPEQEVFGRVTVGVRCEGEAQDVGYLQVKVKVVGDYVVSRQRIAAGDVISASLLDVRRGPLERLPKGSVLQPGQIIGRQASRSFSRGATLALNNFRERWLVQRNQRVVLQAQGTGFTLRLEGKALDNGSLGSSVRVQGSDGKTLSAQVVGQNELQLRN